MTALVVANTVVLVLLVLLVFGLLRSHASILRRLHDLDGGEVDADGLTIGPAPAAQRVEDPAAPSRPVAGMTLDGEQVVLATSGVEHDTLLVFLTSGCLTCREFWKTFAGPDGVALPAGTRLLIVTKDLAEESPSELAKLAPRDVDLVASSDAWVDFGVPGSPYVVAVEGTSGRIQGEGTGLSWEQVAGLLAQATGDRTYVLGEDEAPLPKPVGDVEREARVDRELLRAGILPGDPSLQPGASSERTSDPGGAAT
jgi:hypothetical protein